MRRKYDNTLTQMSKCASPYCYSSQVVSRPLLESLSGCNAPNLIAIGLGKPEITIGSGCDSPWVAAGSGNRKFGDRTIETDAPNLIASKLGKPEVAIGSSCDIK